MKSLSQPNIYEFHAVCPPEDSLRQFSDHAAREIQRTAGLGTDVQVKIEAKPGSGACSVHVTVFGPWEPISVARNGHSLLATLRKVKKAALRRIQRRRAASLSRQRKLHFRDAMVS